jgi:hypothetical protein
VVLDVQVLAIERRLQRIPEELAHVRDGLELHGASSGLFAPQFCKLRRSFAWQSRPGSAEWARL